MPCSIERIGPDLYLVDLPQRRRGFRKFISSWVLVDGDEALVVDVGPRSTARALAEAVRGLGVRAVRYVLLTHIHIDHAGGVADFLEEFPARVVVHPLGKRHLVDPSRLWESTKRVLGTLADIYGEIRPVPEKYIHEGPVEFMGSRVEVVETPGHAPHHQSYVIGKYLFAGEAGGTYLGLGEEFYLRPATPPRFVYEVAVESIDKLLDLGDLTMCYAHYGMNPSSRRMLKAAREQLDMWLEVIREVVEEGLRGDEAIEEARRRLLDRDHFFSRYKMLDEDIKEREDVFVANSIRGMLGYVLEKEGESMVSRPS